MTQSRTMTDIWTYGDYGVQGDTDISGFKVEAIDGEIGSIDEATWDVGASYLIVDTGPWIFGKKVMLPAGVIDRIDVRDQRVFVHRSKAEIQNAPEFDESRYKDEMYRLDIGTYYGEGGPGYRIR
ncbi:MAG: PRC-barrel domain containing protein [Chloroflexota bacterium]|nr:PRC-barrel domain containing protein [Chloroflexota bacterium]